MITHALLLVTASSFALDLPGMPGVDVSTPPAPAAPATPPPAAPAPAPAAEVKAPALYPPQIPARPKATLETAGDVARDLALRAQYFEDGQAYYRAFTKGGSHTAEENQAFVKFLEEYEVELGIAKRTHALLGTWLEKKSSVKD